MRPHIYALSIHRLSNLAPMIYIAVSMPDILLNHQCFSHDTCQIEVILYMNLFHACLSN